METAGEAAKPYASGIGHTSLNQQASLQGADRREEKRVRRYQAKLEEEQKQQQKEEERLREEGRRREQAEAAAAVPFQPQAQAMLDPKAYFAQWQQHQRTCQANVDRINRGGKAGGKSGSGKGLEGRGKGATGVQRSIPSAQPSVQQFAGKNRAPAAACGGQASLGRGGAGKGSGPNRGRGGGEQVSGMGLLGDAYADSD
eukprot:TRINITY_DN19363_c0_g1_i1.p1 TRINITY_DN19363_c0_g1~~TRINITY_DN19363_c0_g1_i1.p1  ORF type:complete len:213 (-),score=59.66 TRINITY_DN19363_c0_g1_i1:19-618(-)